MRGREASPGGDLDRLARLGHLGAGHAAEALARLLGAPIRVGPSRPWDADATSLDEPAAGVFFTVEGASCRSQLALFLSAAMGSSLMAAQHLRDPPELDTAWAGSILCEVGNMLISRAVSAVADVCGERLMPSTPRLALTAPYAAFAARLRAANAASQQGTMNVLASEGDAQRCLLVWVLNP